MNYTEWRRNPCCSYSPPCTCFLWCAASFSHLEFSHNLCGPVLLPSSPPAPIASPCTSCPALPMKTKWAKADIQKKHTVCTEPSNTVKKDDTKPSSKLPPFVSRTPRLASCADTFSSRLSLHAWDWPQSVSLWSHICSDPHVSPPVAWILQVYARASCAPCCAAGSFWPGN